MRTVFAVYVWLVWALHMLLWGPVAVLATLISPHLGFWVVKAGSFTALGLAGIRVRVSGQDRVDWTRSHVLMGNHQGILDPFILVMALPGHAVGIEKRENFAIPIYGQLARAWGNLPIDRSNPEAARVHHQRQLRAAAAQGVAREAGSRHARVGRCRPHGRHEPRADGGADGAGASGDRGAFFGARGRQVNACML